MALYRWIMLDRSETYEIYELTEGDSMARITGSTFADEDLGLLIPLADLSDLESMERFE